MLEFLLNQLQTYHGCLCDLCPLNAFIFSDLNYKMAIFLSQTEGTPKHFFLEKKKSSVYVYMKQVGQTIMFCVCVGVCVCTHARARFKLPYP
jgi:hypothetical protein